MNILIGAIEKAGLNRGRIMDALRDYQMKTYSRRSWNGLLRSHPQQPCPRQPGAREERQIRILARSPPAWARGTLGGNAGARSACEVTKNRSKGKVQKAKGKITKWIAPVSFCFDTQRRNKHGKMRAVPLVHFAFCTLPFALFFFLAILFPSLLPGTATPIRRHQSQRNYLQRPRPRGVRRFAGHRSSDWSTAAAHRTVSGRRGNSATRRANGRG